MKYIRTANFILGVLGLELLRFTPVVFGIPVIATFIFAPELIGKLNPFFLATYALLFVSVLCRFVEFLWSMRTGTENLFNESVKK
jgi:hypothetical protein